MGRTTAFFIEALDEHKCISCKILADSCKKYESSMILAEKRISWKILADDVILAKKNADNVVFAKIFQDSCKKRLVFKNLARLVILRKRMQYSLRIMHYLESSCRNLAGILNEMHFISTRDAVWVEQIAKNRWNE